VCDYYHAHSFTYSPGDAPAEYAMKVTTLRLPETMHESIEAEAAEQEMSVAEYIRAVLRTRQEHTPEHLSEPAAGASAGEYDELRERVGELEERVDELEGRAESADESKLAQPTNETADIDLSGAPSSTPDPYGRHVETAIEALRQADEPLRKREIMAVVPEADIKDDSLWTEHIRPGIKERGATMRGKRYVVESEGELASESIKD
jgi:hypothetical protein